MRKYEACMWKIEVFNMTRSGILAINDAIPCETGQ